MCRIPAVPNIGTGRPDGSAVISGTNATSRWAGTGPSNSNTTRSKPTCCAARMATSVEITGAAAVRFPAAEMRLVLLEVFMVPFCIHVMWRDNAKFPASVAHCPPAGCERIRFLGEKTTHGFSNSRVSSDNHRGADAAKPRILHRNE